MKRGVDMKPIIGVLPLIDTEKESYWMLPGYMDGIRQAGGLPVMLPLTDRETEIQQLISLCNGFLFTGGQDVSPELYGEQALPVCGECSIQRDHMEMMLFNKALLHKKSVLGICRGIQFINVALGGTLYQDVPTQTKTGLEHHQAPPYDKPVHDVLLSPDTPLYHLLGTDRLSVNSYHHQAVKEPAHDLQIMATATDGLIEAVCMPDMPFVWAVQWHPEFSYPSEESSRKIFHAFVKNCSTHLTL